MTALVVAILIFVILGIGFLGSNLLLGWLVRPNKPSPEKGEIYECGEEAQGSAWNQFDMRFYVVALLFVIFDVEIAFLFPWAVVFGSANRLADTSLSDTQRQAAVSQFTTPGTTVTPAVDSAAYGQFAQFAFFEFALFFGILILGFAYLWSRGDLEWVRSIAGQSEPGKTENRPN